MPPSWYEARSRHPSARSPWVGGPLAGNWLETASSVGVQLKEGQTMLKSAIRRWRDWRRERHIERQERKINARTALRDYKKATGHEGGAPGGG